jgi:putative ABC transport system permease protein
MKWLDSTVQDLRLAFRGWAKTPGFTLAAVVTLALGIGANTAVFSVISGVLLRPLPYADPDRLVQVNEIQPRSASSIETNGPVWPADFKEFRSHSRLLAGFITYHVSSGNLFGLGEPEQLSIVPAERGLFSLLGATPLAGRTIARNDPPNVTVVSRAFSLAHFGAAPAAVGRTLNLDGQILTVMASCRRSSSSLTAGPASICGFHGRCLQLCEGGLIQWWLGCGPASDSKPRGRN